MKKTKIFLTALTVMTIVGGALAFKARVQFHYAQCDVSSQLCTLNDFFSFATTEGGTDDANFDVYGKPCIKSKCTTLTSFFQ